MRELRALALAGACVLGIALAARLPVHPLSERSLSSRAVFEQGLDSLVAALDQLDWALASGAGAAGGHAAAAVGAFRKARGAYKRLEVLLEPYGPAVVQHLNGPVEVDEDHAYRPLGEPAGFQVLESALFDQRPSVGGDSLRATVRAMRHAVATLRSMTPRLHFTDADLLDALRLEIARVSTLGVAGFDAPRSGDAIVESATALEGALELSRRGGSGGARWRPVDSALHHAARYLRAHPEFDGFDRLEFIVSYANPLARAVTEARRGFGAPPPLRRLWRQAAATVFEWNAFDASAFAPADGVPASPALTALGRRLFFDPVLSGPRTRSCASCHDPRRAFTDGRERSALLAASDGPHRNTPTLLGAGYEPALFDDSRAQSLEMQAGMVLANPSEMASSSGLAAQRLRADSSYRAAFASALGQSADRAITPRAVEAALAAYVRSLGALNSRFDRAVRGDTDALTATERLGFNVFMGKARCGTCHFAPLFDGTMPPEFVRSEAEIIGVPDRPNPAHARLDADPGLAGVDLQPVHRGAFKVPTLRNVARTAPYMHNGVFKTLEEVVDFYDRGGGVGSGLHVPNQTLRSDSLHLSAAEKGELVAFLESLTAATAPPDHDRP